MKVVKTDEVKMMFYDVLQQQKKYVYSSERSVINGGSVGAGYMRSPLCPNSFIFMQFLPICQIITSLGLPNPLGNPGSAIDNLNMDF